MASKTDLIDLQGHPPRNRLSGVRTALEPLAAAFPGLSPLDPLVPSPGRAEQGDLPVIHKRSLVISREAARTLGLTHYKTGVACAHGHRCRRYVSGGECFACKRLQTRNWFIANPERGRALFRRWWHQSRRQAELAEMPELEDA